MKTGFKIIRLLAVLILLSIIPVKAYSNSPGSGMGKTKMYKPAVVNSIERPGMANPVTGKRLSPFSITLTVQNFLSSIAKLSWIPTDLVSDGSYFIERQVAASGVWDIVKQLPYNAVLQYNDTITFPYCSSTDFIYRVRLVSVSAGTIISNNGVCNGLWDQTPPAIVQDVMVSTGLSGYPELSWRQLTGDSIIGYEIARYNFKNLNWPIIDTVMAGSGTFTDLSALNMCDTSYRYVVLTLDKCGRNSAPSYPLVFVQTLLLNLPPVSECDRLARLSWNAYHAMPGRLGGYKIFRSADAGAPLEIADLKDTLSNSYNDAFSFVNSHKYSYFVKAYSVAGQDSSISCLKSFVYKGASVPDSIYISQVSVEADSFIRINYHYSQVNTVKKLLVQRADTPAGVWATIDTLRTAIGTYLPVNGSFDDTTANVHGQSYYYRLAALDSCNAVIIYSVNSACSMFLVCMATDIENSISWNLYDTWLKGVSGYTVFHQVDGLPAAGDLAGSVAAATDNFSESSTGFAPSAIVCYWAMASENPLNPYLVNAKSVSNTCCIIKGANLYMPTAFCPEGKNYRFRPVASFVDPFSFKMTIFDRWGQQIFETTDMFNGWDGTTKGQNVPPGIYAYVLSYKSVGGEAFSRRGTVMLIR
ncbi:MAG: gliding motility-associated C-terminal domain-containing protein [Bacteroidota bacterium]